METTVQTTRRFIVVKKKVAAPITTPTPTPSPTSTTQQNESKRREFAPLPERIRNYPLSYEKKSWSDDDSEDDREIYCSDPRREYLEYQVEPKEYREEPRRDYRDEPRRDYREEPRRDYREEPRRDYRDDRKDYREEPRRDYRDEPRRDYRDDRKNYRDEPRRDYHDGRKDYRSRDSDYHQNSTDSGHRYSGRPRDPINSHNGKRSIPTRDEFIQEMRRNH